MSTMRYIITYAVVALIIVGVLLVIREASEFDYAFVNKCHAAGGSSKMSNGMKQCIKDGSMIFIGEQ